MTDKVFKIANLYPKLLNSGSNQGNILFLKKRCERRNITCIVDEIDTAEQNINTYDMYYIGDGLEFQLTDATDKLLNIKDFLHSEAERGAVFLGIGGGYQILGKSYETKDGNKKEALAILNSYTIMGEKRFTGNVTVNSTHPYQGTLVGFENHAGQTFLEGNTLPLGIISTGNGNNGTDKTEGANYKNVFGTYLSGPFLPKNYKFADYLTELALGEKLTPLDDDIENAVHQSLINKI
ncbi:MAG: glutamine amidotransferase [bacterium]|nr:glutamine amidotransferase [bacterium]